MGTGQAADASDIPASTVRSSTPLDPPFFFLVRPCHRGWAWATFVAAEIEAQHEDVAADQLSATTFQPIAVKSRISASPTLQGSVHMLIHMSSHMSVHMSMSIHVSLHMPAHVSHTCQHTCPYMTIHMSTCYTYLHAGLFTCLSSSPQARLHTCLYTGLCTCLHVCGCTHTHTSIPGCTWLPMATHMSTEISAHMSAHLHPHVAMHMSPHVSLHTSLRMPAHTATARARARACAWHLP